MNELGRILRLQVQTDAIKSGGKPYERYTPHPNLVSVAALRLNADGVEGVGFDGTVLPDVHNRTHPHSRCRGDNGISIGFTSHYAAMRKRFGDHLSDGIAGENILIAHDQMVELAQVADGVEIAGDSGRHSISPWIVANPCNPFSRFCLQMPDDQRPDRTVTEALQFLGNGKRGYTAVWTGDPIEIRVGDVVYA